MSHKLLQTINPKRPYRTHIVEEETENGVTHRGGHKRPRLTQNETASCSKDEAPVFNVPTTTVTGCVPPNTDHVGLALGQNHIHVPEGTKDLSCQCNKPESLTHCKNHALQGSSSLSQVWGRYAMSNAKLRECHFLRINRSRQYQQDNTNSSSTK